MYHPNEGEIIRLRNLFLECNQIMRVARDPHTLLSAKCNLQTVLTNPTFSKASAELLSVYGIERGERVDDVVFEKMFGDPREELLKFITRELYKVVNVNVNRYKRLRTVGDDDDHDDGDDDGGAYGSQEAKRPRASR
jgi:hypothetical protein